MVSTKNSHPYFFLNETNLLKYFPIQFGKVSNRHKAKQIFVEWVNNDRDYI